MHDTAYAIGRLVLEAYGSASAARILEIGSLDVNGSLRTHLPAGNHYVGLDFEDGPGVDHVIKPGSPWPVPDRSFDIVIASSVFEHDATFWLTFLEMIEKTRPGGYIYLNAPSNGEVHRYPLDCWRFYSDAGSALAGWAKSQDLPVVLVESFVAERDSDIWNDFCAVFRREPSTDALPESFVFERVACTNVITWQSPQLIAERAQPEDMVIVAGEREARTQLEARHAELLDRHDHATKSVSDLECRLAAAEAWASRMSDDKAALEQGRIALIDARDRLVSQLEESANLRRSHEQARIEDAGTIAEQKTRLEESSRQTAEMRDELRKSISARNALNTELAVRFQEIATLSNILVKTERERDVEASNAEWLRKALVAIAMLRQWPSFFSRSWHSRRVHQLLRRLGIFDGDAYLQLYPDVANEGMDPLLHYLSHGMTEGRERTGQDAGSSGVRAS